MGMRLCAAANDVMFRDIERFIKLLNITHLSLTPSVAALIRPSDIPDIEMLVTAGEALTPKVFRDWAGRGLYQAYGPSETTNICSVQCQVSASDRINNIGKPLPNTSMFISSSEVFRPLPLGALGEIWIGGDQVGRGYLNDTNLTAQKFIEHRKYGKLYRSGDLGRMLPDGSTLFHGREDDQIKLRGQRIELGEIEHALLNDSAVSDGICLLIDGSEQRSRRLVAYWSLKPSLSVDPIAYNKPLFDKLRSRLPTYMVPEYLIHVDLLPLTSQGKTDKKALKQVFLNMDLTALSKYSREEDIPQVDQLVDAIEIRVAQAVADVTRSPLPFIGRNTSFFALGLDSINCISLSRRLLQSGCGSIDVSLILRHSSVAKLSRVISATSAGNPAQRASNSRLQHIFDERWQESVILEYAQRGCQVQKILPCTPLQQAMLSHIEGGSDGAYRNQLKFRFVGDLAQLKDAWKACIAAHEIMRTGFVLTNSSQFPFAQVVLDEFKCPWNSQNHSDVTQNAWEQILMPPYSFTVWMQPENLPPLLILRIHHALYDAQAVSMLLHDVERVFRGGTPSPVSSLEPYLEYMVGLDEEHANKFWTAHLKEYRPKLVPQPQQESEPESSAWDLVLRVSSQTPFQRLLQSSKQTSVTILSLLQLTWARLLAYHFANPDICFGNVYSGRNLPIRDVESIIGPCFNTLPIRIILEKRDTNQQIAKRIQDHSLATLCSQPFSLRSIQRNQGVSRLFDTLLLLQAEPAELDPSIWTLEEELGEMKFPLILEIIPRSSSNQLDLVLHVQRGVLPQRGAETILSDFETLLEHTIRYPDAIATDFFIFGNKSPPMWAQPPPPADVATKVHLDGPELKIDWSPLESSICDVFRKLSDRDLGRIKRDTTIFHLGFDSLSAIQIAAELRKEGYNLSSGDVLEAATVPGIASLYKRRIPNAPDDTPLLGFDDFNKSHFLAVCQRHSIDDDIVEEIRPCTPFQLGILTDFVRSGGQHYLNSMHYELNANVDLHRLKEAWETATVRHDILRTGFVEVDDVRCPFAMILYSPGKRALLWLEDDETLAQNPLDHTQSLHEPPWQISIKDRGARKNMQLSMLHALFDARTLELLLEDVAAAYSDGVLPEFVPVKPFISRILHRSLSSLADSKSAFNDLPLGPPVRFPDLRLDNVNEAGFYTIEYNCSHTLSQLDKSCRKAGVTLQVAGQCAWARLLSAYTGETVQTFGVVVSGRSGDNGEESVLFPCINTVPVSLKVGGSTNCKLLAAAAGSNATLMKNPHAASRWSSSTPKEALDSVFVFQNRGSTKPSSLWELVAEDARADYTVSVEMLANDLESLRFRLTLRKQNISIEQGSLLVKQLDAVLWDTLDRPDDEALTFIRIDNELISISPAKDPLIKTEVQYLHQFVENSARKRPEKTSFEFAANIVDGQVTKASWSYSQLDEEGNKIAQILQRSGAVPGNLIAICFEKCPEASFTILGVLKAGCAYVALDPSAPEARKRFILEDSGCRILCTTQDRAGFLSLANNLQVLSIDELLKDKDLPCHAVALSRQLAADDVCYCLYTSGTTGTPKGCLITHGNAVQFVLAFQRLFAGHWDSESRFLQFASFHFDVSVMEQYWSWSIGICVTSAPRDLLFEDLPAAIRALQITHIDLTPSLARLLTPTECPSLCRGAFITGGEQLRQDIIDTWGDEGVIYNGYGPSEVTIGCTMYPRVPKSAKPSNIGPAYDNVGAYVLDVNTKYPVLRGAVGELCVSGPLVGKGYLNRKDLTAEKFEFLNHLQARVYHTGDIVRLLHDGSFCFIGRADDQVKLRGQRLEIGEINHIIQRSSGKIQEVATMVLRHRENSKDQLVSFIASSEKRARAERTAIDFDSNILSIMYKIRSFCNNSLPSYMVPTFLIPVTMMPLSANNKVDTKPLKALFEATSAIQLQELSTTKVRQSNIDPEATRRVIEIICRVIGIPEDAVIPSSRLFELGLDSITAISLSRLLKSAGFDAANPSMIMRNSVVADLVISLTESGPTLDDSKTASQVAKQEIAAFERSYRPTIEKALGSSSHEIQKIAPCTPLQQGMIARCLNSDNAVYFSSFTFALNASMDIPRLLVAWTQVENNNEILRTKFVPTDEGYAQAVCKDAASHSTRFRQLEIEPNASYDDALRRDFVNWTENAKGLESDLWGLDIYHMPQEILMTLKIFHGLYDGISLALMLEEVACIYSKKSSSNASPSYHDVLPHGPLMSPTGSKDFWTKAVRAVCLLDLHTKYELNAPIMLSCHVASSNPVKKLRLQLNVPEAAIFQACWLMTMKQRFGIFPTIGSVVSGRAFDVDGIENVVGPLFNTIPCQIDVDALSTWADLVKACHSFNVRAIPYQHTPLSRISKWLGLNSTEPLFDSLFVFQKQSRGIAESPKLWTHVNSRAQPDYPLALEVEQGVDDALTYTILAQGQYLCREEVYGLLDIFKSFLTDLSEDLHQPLPSAKARGSRPLYIRRIEGCSAGPAASRQILNGSIDSKTSFSWDAISSVMRCEIAKLSALDIDDVTPSTSIFELGLDSIDAIKLSARFKSAKISISVSSILQAGCIAEMAKRVSAEKLSPSDKLHPSLDRVCEELHMSLKAQGVSVDDYEKVLPVTPLQESMLANFQQYYSQDVLRLSDGIDVERLKSAWHVAAAAHSVLRTSFVEVDDQKSAHIYAQLVSREVKLECISTSLENEADLQIILANQQAQAGLGGINQAALRLTFVRIGLATFLVVGLPHAMYDGWSINLLHQDVVKCFNGLQCTRPSYEPILERILGAVSDTSRSFWSHQLSGLHPRAFSLPQHEQPAQSTTNRHEMSSELSVAQATAFCRAAGVTFQSLALTCWALVLSRYLKSRDVCFGVVLAGRDIENADQMMFPTMNTVPFRVILQKNKLAMVKGIHELILVVSEHQHFPLRKAKSLLKDSTGQLFDTLFLYQKRPLQREQPEPLYTSVGGLSNPEYPVNVEMELLNDCIVWRTACNSHMLDMEATQLLLCNIDIVLGSLVTETAKPAFESSSDGISICGLPAFSDWAAADDVEAHASLAKGTYRDQSGLLPNEKIITEVLSDVSNVGREEIRRHTNLFQLGLDSISAIKVSSALKKRSISLSVSEILKALTVQKMAEAAKPAAALGDKRLSRQGEGQSVQLLDQTPIRHRLKQLGIQADQIEDILPCTPGQEFFLSMWHASNGKLFYPDFHYRVEDPSISRQIISTAWKKLVQAAPILRTTFLPSSTPHNTATLQIILKEAFTPVIWTEKEDTRPAPDYTPFTTTTTSPAPGPAPQPPALLYATQTTSSATTTTHLKLRIHHALYDGVSLPKLMQAFESFCHHNAPSSSSPRLDTDFRAYLNHLHCHTNKEQQKRFWIDYLHGCAPTPSRVVTSSSPPSSSTLSSSSTAERLHLFRPGLITNLTALEKKLKLHAVSLQALFFAAYARAHVTCVGGVGGASSRSQDEAGEGWGEDLVVGVYLANRSNDVDGVDEEGLLLAPMVNVVPMRIPVRKSRDAISASASASAVASSSLLFESATEVQAVLGRVGSLEHGSGGAVSLGEVYEWTGVKVGCYVNFLRLPGEEERGGEQVLIRGSEGDRGNACWNGVVEEMPPGPFVDKVPERDDGVYLVSFWLISHALVVV
jgi:ferricrocin synthase